MVKDEQNLNNDFNDFLNNSQEPTGNLGQNLLFDLKSDIRQNKFLVLVKFFILQIAAGFVTLSVCPQFGIGPIGGGHGISHIFMEIGVWACALFCGFFYFFCSVSLSLLLLTKAEIHLIKTKKWSLSLLVLALSFLIFMLLNFIIGIGQTLVITEFLLFWFFASVFGTVAGFNFSLRFKLS